MSESIVVEVERWAREFRKGSTRLALLAVLAEGESYGYEILSRLRARAEGPWSANEATVYPLLHDLEARGFLSSRWRTTDAGVPPRKYYTLTGDGRRLADALADAWKAYRKEMDRLIGGK